MENKVIKVAVASLGCSKNLIDSEQMMANLRNNGFELWENEEDADVIIVNTCTFIEDARVESIHCILEMAQYKKSGKAKLLVVTGCMAQRYKEQILSEIPEVDLVLGTNDYNKIAAKINELLDSAEDTDNPDEPAVMKNENVYCSDTPLLLEYDRVRTTPKYTAYLKIAEGCDNRCTYCVIPSIRGRYRSRKIEDIISEAEKMAQDGVKEIIVIAQDTTRYGIDLYGEYRLPQLLSELCRIDGISWVRVHYCYPELVTDELIDVFAREDKLCKYFDIPIQHCNDRILKLMGRRTNKEQIVTLINKLRERIPNVVIRTSLIVGFPGETEEEFDELCDFVSEMRFDRMGAFTYSREEDTPAYSMKNQVDEEEKRRRQEVIMVTQAEVDDEKNAAKIGTTAEVLVEGRDEIIKSYFGRTYADSIEIDGKVFFKSDRKFSEGDFVNVKIEQAMDMDLFGTED